jgi:hypothetical protein
VRAGRGCPHDYDDWMATNDQWAYERGRAWGSLTPRSVPLKTNGKVTAQARQWFCQLGEDIL